MRPLSQPTLFELIKPNLDTRESWFEHILTSLDIKNEAGWPDKFGQSLRMWLKDQGHQPIKTLSLFSGGGGLDIAFHDAGFEILQSVEIEKAFAQTLMKNSGPGRWFEHSKVNNIDIRQFQPNNLDVDFIIGGPPCQTFSAAGRRASGVQGTDDPRGMLFWEYVRLLKQLSPKGFLFENVYGITGAQDGRAWKEIEDAFQAAGYKIFSRILDAADYGVPQHRERLFIVGIREGNYKFPFPTHGPDSPGQQNFYSAGEAVKGADVSDATFGINGQHGYLLDNIPPGLNYSFYTQKMGFPKPIFGWRSKFSDYLYKADPDSPVRTIKAQGGQYTGPFSWENRAFTLAELKRLQTFPDSYEVSGSRLTVIKQLGNSVPPQIGRILAVSILDQVMDARLPFIMHYMSEGHKLSFRWRKRNLTEIYRSKAKESIEQMVKDGKVSFDKYYKFQEGTATRFLSPNFVWQPTPSDESTRVILSYEISDQQWLFKAGLHNRDISKDVPTYEIGITLSESHANILSTKEVKLFAYSLDYQVFTSLWKFFEEKLAELTGKADLVQLFGYYQYAKEDKIKFRFHDPSRKDKIFWKIVAKVVSGEGVAVQLQEETISLAWEISKDEILPNLIELKRLGYEVRNINTNPQIPKGETLIPYSFPTLTWRSVQLHKSLEVQVA